MSQHDFNIANQSFPGTRSDLNNALVALATNSSGAAAPSTTNAFMSWADSGNDIMKLRNEANSDWISLYKTDGVQQFASGSTAGLPAFSKPDDVDTGIYFPAADNIAIATGGTGRLYVDSSGNVGLNNATPSATLDVAGDMVVDTNTLKVDSTNNRVGIGISSPLQPLSVIADSNAAAIGIHGRSSDNIGEMIFYANDGTTQYGRLKTTSTVIHMSGTNNSNGIYIYNSGKVNINPELEVANNSAASGDSLISSVNNTQNTSAGNSISDCFILFDAKVPSSNSAIGFKYYNNAFYSSNLEVGLYSSVRYSKLNRNCYHILCEDPQYSNTLANGSALFMVYGDGDVVNKDNSYGSTSDLKLKTDIIDSGSQWDDILNLKIRKYKFKSDVKTEKESDDYVAIQQIGVIAQELEDVGMGGLVSEVNGTKNVKYSVLYIKAIAALQEAMNRIEKLEAGQKNKK